MEALQIERLQSDSHQNKYPQAGEVQKAKLSMANRRAVEQDILDYVASGT